MIGRRGSNSQFVCSTHPIASLLSTDMFLCFDGDNFGLYNPWRSVQNIDAHREMDPELREYLYKKGAFEMPPIAEQRELFQLFLDKLYHMFPVINRSDIENIKSLSPLLLNAIFLAATRCDGRLDRQTIRSRSQQLYERCQLLELAESNKIVLIQSYLLMSIQEEGVNGESLAKEYVTKACMLCGDLALTNLGGSDGMLMDESKSRTYKNTVYKKGILSRIFWTSFCCDRLAAATSGREMYYNYTDIIIDELSIDDYEAGPSQVNDFMFLKSWYEICKFLFRILDSFYKPPERRGKDHSLPRDLFNWEMKVELYSSSLSGQISLMHAYACLLYLRCKMDPISLITSKNSPSDLISDDYIILLHKYSSVILSIDTFFLQTHILGVHAILHVMALAQLELQALPSSDETGEYLITVKQEVLGSLEHLKNYWWLASSSLKLLHASTKN
ncbi:uncharacterized protein SPAPADRAFT_140944 [Spathaspora passalidarum NRRL Y-27907]|uniref:Xylanolytic transcriptional activator regulatory domain-containing protein n=1 Tax=Spathaspora passalidarum (strain NRRL Y-27907 / 11-Y1) TaxID=619300 RepID=G3ARU2_SPAPN|nr:uncharacterized protein SPAPADRAFT_140944 [Spathaspora passalidarum NRRL Y-27907]EGW31359.1 hypothetical protein SPAPADRAFT_140944 [Spathaspora passalidarum NRRL Y-27907]